jgi:hypothetical protein
MAEPDAQLRRIVRGTLVACAALMALAAVAGGARAALGVAAGALVVGVSYRGVRAGIDAMIANGVGSTQRGASSPAWGFVRFITRFAMLGGVAYVMMVRLRAHPGWMLAGASSLVAAAACEAVRGLRRARS